MTFSLPPDLEPQFAAYCRAFENEEQLLKALGPDQLIVLISAALQESNWRSNHKEFMGKLITKFQSLKGDKAEWLAAKILEVNRPALIAQIQDVIAHSDHAWSKERLTQILKYDSGESSFDSFLLRQMKKKYGEETHLKTLKLNAIFTLATASLYDSVPTKNKKIAVTGEVSTDGWGDLFQMLVTSQILKRSMQDAAILLSTDLRHRPKPPGFPKSSFVVEDLIIYSEGDLESAKAKLREADLIVHIPHGTSLNPGAKPSMKVEEYGFDYTTNYSLGLSPVNPKILGVPLPAPSDAESLQELTDPFLKKMLWNPFFLGYIKKDHSIKEEHRAGFILAATASCRHKTQDIDIVCPLEEISSLDLTALKQQNVGRVVLIKNEEVSITLNPKGKVVRILNPFPLSNQDWMTLLKFCEPLVGCTGDLSWSEVIANKKLPFYQIRWHKDNFFDQIISLAGYVYKEEFPKLHKFLTLMQETLQEVSEANLNYLELGDMCDEELIAESEKFAQYIEKYYCSNTILTNQVKRELAYAAHPDLKSIEQAIFQQWSNGEITLMEASTYLARCI